MQCICVCKTANRGESAANQLMLFNQPIILYLDLSPLVLNHLWYSVALRNKPIFGLSHLYNASHPFELYNTLKKREDPMEATKML